MRATWLVGALRIGSAAFTGTTLVIIGQAWGKALEERPVETTTWLWAGLTAMVAACCAFAEVLLGGWSARPDCSAGAGTPDACIAERAAGAVGRCGRFCFWGATGTSGSAEGLGAVTTLDGVPVAERCAGRSRRERRVVPAA